MFATGFRVRLVGLFVLAALAVARLALAQGGYNDDRVMIQGFMWESHQEGRQTAHGSEYEVHWKENWYDHVREQVGELADARFDLIWLPPPSEGEGAGYHPRQYYDFDNNYGSEAEHRAVIRALLEAGIEPVADMVINHRNGTGGWATFKNPDWPAKYICRTDEFWSKTPETEPTLSEEDKQILADGDKGAKDFQGSDFWNWDGARDLDHKNQELRKEMKKYTRKLRKYGYRGWRYDMVKGFHPGFVAEYNFASRPTFAVGEYMDGNARKLTKWVDGTKWRGQADPARKACSAFDFATQERLRDFINAGKYDHLPAIHHKDNVHDGLIAFNKDKAVTFLENHDTGYPQKQFDSFPNGPQVLQGYAYILTHPGLPCVYWKHYFDWGHGDAIKALIRARKYAGVHSGSYIKTEVHDGAYVAIIGDKPHETSTLIVKIGPGLGFQPDENVWGLGTHGPDYAVWVRKTKKARTKDKIDATKPPLPIPTPQ